MGLKPINEMLDAMEWEYVTLPYMIFKKYREYGITDSELVVILHIIAYQQIERNFPNLSELEDRMGLDQEQIAAILQKLFASGLIAQMGNRISIRPLIEKMVGISDNNELLVSVFTRFEEEFGRLLSPIEYEQISRWLEEDHYPEWMIVEALRESVLAGVYNFRYVDSILREWERANIKSESQLTEHRKRHIRQPKGRNTNTSIKPNLSGDKKAKEPNSKDSDRVVPAAQPGKYERFYQVYKNNSNPSATK